MVEQASRLFYRTMTGKMPVPLLFSDAVGADGVRPYLGACHAPLPFAASLAIVNDNLSPLVTVISYGYSFPFTH